ncbi:MAG: leucine-rich repeat domain-containing protein [Planctomycetota bacterium]
MNESKVKVIVMGVAILFIVPATLRAEDPVYFADANLKAVVEEALGITEPTPTDMLALSYLGAYNRRIVNLTGLEYATNLEKLDFIYTWLIDISALSGLTNLITLELNGNQITDISALSGLTNLRYLYLWNNQVSDISALSGLTNLESLILWDNQVSDISSLSGLTNLSYLSLRMNHVSDISALSKLTNLGYLELNWNQISDISSLSGLKNLPYLNISHNQISDISALSGLTNLRWLELNGNDISDISSLSGLTNLKWLDLLNNPLDRDAYCVYIPMILDNNPFIDLYSDPNPYVCSISVEIDIKPGSYPNTINLGSFGLVPVAILSSDGFDATTVDPDTVELAGSGVAVRGKGSKLMAHEEDINGDNLVDLLVQVSTENLDPDSFQDGYAILTGSTYDGQAIKGQDEITIVPPEE